MNHDVWEAAFVRSQMMWGEGPAKSAVLAAEQFAKAGIADVLIPGVGYGRNALPFLERGMKVTGIEVSETAIALAREKMKLDLPIHHGSVTDMPFDDRTYGGVFSFGLLYLLDAEHRAKLLRDCARQLVPGGAMVFTVISKAAPMFRQGKQLGEDWYEIHPGIRMFFYDDESLKREFGPYGLIEISDIGEPQHNGAVFPFKTAVCSIPPQCSSRGSAG